MIRRPLAVLATAAAALATAAAALPTAAPARAAGQATALPSPYPAVVPTLRSWTSAPGQFTVSPRARIVVSAPGLHPAAATFARDLRLITGLSLAVGSGPARTGDIVLSTGNIGLPAEGYHLHIGTTVTITGQDSTGLFYGTQSVEQMLKASPADEVLPDGTASDWPSLSTRGVMMLNLVPPTASPGAAPEVPPVPFVEEQIRMAAWYKISEIHLDLADELGYTLPSSRYPGLPVRGHYTFAGIAAIVGYAQRYHVTLVPEVDVPAHATELTSYDHKLRWDCPSIEDQDYYGSTGYPYEGFTIDITKPAATTMVENLVSEIIRMFPHSPVIHLGGDEYPSYAQQQACPELVSYASEHGYASTEDVFTAWQNTLAAYVKARGRQMEIWNWSDVVGNGTIPLSHSIIIEDWIGHPASYWESKGYQVVSSPDDDTPDYFLYVSPGSPPGGPEVPEDTELYGIWAPATGSPQLLGYESPMWVSPYAYGQWFAQNAWPVMADRTWGGQKLASVFDFEDVLDAIGAPPGYPDDVPIGQQMLQGTPYGSPAVSSAHGVAEAFDGDPSTYYESASTNGGYVGIALAAPAQVTAIRFVPVPDPNPDSYAAGGLANSLDMVGGQFQGCTTGPATGCTDLAGVDWRSTYDWHQLTVTDHERFRWLRYVGAARKPVLVSEIQFLSTPAEPQRLTVTPPASLQPGGSTTVTATFTNAGTHRVTRLRPELTATSTSALTSFPAKLATMPPATVAPGRSVTISWRVYLPASATAGTYDLAARATYQTRQPTGPPGSQAVAGVAGTTG
jgi:hypothetical protein